MATSKYKGVYYNKARDNWRAEIYYLGVKKSLGSYDEELDAAIAYDNQKRYYKRLESLLSKEDIIKNKLI